MNERLDTLPYGTHRTFKTANLASKNGNRQPPVRFTVSGLFAGIGGFEVGFLQRGHHTSLLCELDPAAQRVLAHRFPAAELIGDIRDLGTMPECDVITAGFPCQDLSQAGKTKGLGGTQSSLIKEVLRLLEGAPDRVKWLVLENVPFMLHLHRGQAIREVTAALSHLGWRWAYRIVDAMAFGLPQRRRRLFLLASRTQDPRPVLLGADTNERPLASRQNFACGFYWTEGHRGLGWAVDAIPPLKGGSSLSIPSPPAVWFPKRRSMHLPSIEDAERLQGFPAGWSEAASLAASGPRYRWRLVGNAVSVPVAAWLADRLCELESYDASQDEILAPSAPWPDAAWGVDGRVGRSNVSDWPITTPAMHLASFLGSGLRPLSLNAAAGFLARLEHSSLRCDQTFIGDLRRYVAKERRVAKKESVDPTVSRRMAATRGRDNPAELALRSKLHRQGYRFRVHFKVLPGLRRTADIAFPALRVAIFLDGCFWHGCPVHGTWPKTNARWWRKKIDENRQRDMDTDKRLKASGWLVLRFWEHEKAAIVANRIVKSLHSRKAATLKEQTAK